MKCYEKDRKYQENNTLEFSILPDQTVNFYVEWENIFDKRQNARWTGCEEYERRVEMKYNWNEFYKTINSIISFLSLILLYLSTETIKISVFSYLLSKLAQNLPGKIWHTICYNIQ